jgi:hypothetical protein
MANKSDQRNSDHSKAIEQLIKQVCKQYLDKHYSRLALMVLKRLVAVPQVSLSGKAGGWAGGILWALFEHNFYHDAPEPIGAMLAEVLDVNVNTIRNRRNQVEDALGMDNAQGAVDYMHPAVYDMLEQIAMPDMPMNMADAGLQAMTIELSLPPLAPEAQQALMQAFHNKLDQIMQTGDLDLARMKSLAAEFGITVIESEPDQMALDPLFDVQSQRPS